MQWYSVCVCVCVCVCMRARGKGGGVLKQGLLTLLTPRNPSESPVKPTDPLLRKMYVN